MSSPATNRYRVAMIPPPSIPSFSAIGWKPPRSLSERSLYCSVVMTNTSLSPARTPSFTENRSDTVAGEMAVNLAKAGPRRPGAGSQVGLLINSLEVRLYRDQGDSNTGGGSAIRPSRLLRMARNEADAAPGNSDAHSMAVPSAVAP